MRAGQNVNAVHIRSILSTFQSADLEPRRHGEPQRTRRKTKDDIRKAARREKVVVLEASLLILSVFSVALRVSVVNAKKIF